MKLCSIEGCGREHDAKGFCRSHYKRWKLHGDPLIVKQAPHGSGWVARGRKLHTQDNNKVFEHRIIAARALGKRLPSVAVVHHVDEDPLNNDPSNLVICPNDKYHRLLHQRIESMKATGHYHWRKCPYCKQYDDPQKMREEKTQYEPRYVHVACRNAAQNARRNKNHVSV